MLNLAFHLLLRRRTALRNQHLLFHNNLAKHRLLSLLLLSPQTQQISQYVRTTSSPSLSIWRRKKEIGKEGLIVAKELKRIQSNPVRLDRFIKSHVSRLLKSDLVSVLAEFQRQDQVFLCMKVRRFSSLGIGFGALFQSIAELVLRLERQ